MLSFNKQSISPHHGGGFTLGGGELLIWWFCCHRLCGGFNPTYLARNWVAVWFQESLLCKFSKQWLCVNCAKDARQSFFWLWRSEAKPRLRSWVSFLSVLNWTFRELNQEKPGLEFELSLSFVRLWGFVWMTGAVQCFQWEFNFLKLRLLSTV